MEVIVRRAEVTLACVGQRLASEFATVVPSADDDRVGPHSEAAHRLLESESMEDSRRVGTYLDAGADLAQLGGLFEHANIEASASKRQRRREPADSGADHDDSHVQTSDDESNGAAAARRTRSFAAQTPLRMTEEKMTERRITDKRKCAKQS